MMLSQLSTLIKNSPDHFVLFIGAGACVSAQLPLGDALGKLMLETFYSPSLSYEELKNKFLSDFPKAKEYNELTLEVINHFFLKRYGIPCLNIITTEIEKYQTPPKGYNELRDLCEKKYFKNILTVNFDELLEKALKDLNPIIIGRTSDDTYNNTSIWQSRNEPIILKLHGTVSEPMHLQAAIESVRIVSEKIETHLKFIFENNSVIFVGYSARDQDIIDVIKPLFEVNRQYGYKIYMVSPSLGDSQQKLLQAAGSEDNFIDLQSDLFFRRIKGFILGEDANDSPMQQHLISLGYDVKRVIWTPGTHPYDTQYENAIEVLIYMPNAIRDVGPIDAEIGNNEHKQVIESSKIYYPDSKFWLTYIFSNNNRPRCRVFCSSIPRYGYGGTSERMLPGHLTKYLN